METLLTLKVTATIESIDQLDYEQKRDALIRQVEALQVNVNIETED